jgi:hypothetical protein
MKRVERRAQHSVHARVLPVHHLPHRAYGEADDIMAPDARGGLCCLRMYRADIREQRE